LHDLNIRDFHEEHKKEKVVCQGKTAALAGEGRKQQTRSSQVEKAHREGGCLAREIYFEEKVMCLLYE